MSIPSLSTPAAHAALALGAHYVQAAGVAGDFAEFGTFYGASAQVIAQCMALEHDSTRRLWLFDSFAGLPVTDNPIDQAAPQVADGTWQWRYEHNSRATAEQLMALMTQYLPGERVAIADGWFLDTLPQLPADTRFAFVHLDCDLYESTRQVLDHLFKGAMFADGCALYFDDWYCNRGRPEFGQQKAWADVRKWGYKYADLGTYSSMGHKFALYKD